MPVITHQNKKSAAVERVAQTDITALESPNIQLYLTYRGRDTICEVSPAFAAWLDAKCDDLGVCPLSVLLGCAEHVQEME